MSSGAADNRSLILSWQLLLADIGTVYLWAAVWLGAFTVPFVGWPWVFGIASLTWGSAMTLAPGRLYGRRLLVLALVFIFFWALILGLTNFFNQTSSLRPVLNLIAWLGLGLNLMLAKTPLALALPLGRMLSPLLGQMRSQKLALALVLLARLIPSLLISALDIKKTIDCRAQKLSLLRRLSLWGRAMLREANSQTDDLAATVLKRWPWSPTESRRRRG